MKTSLTQRWQDKPQLQLLRGGLRALSHVTRLELKEGTLAATVTCMLRQRAPAFAQDWSFAELLEWAAATWRYQPFLHYRQQVFSFNDMNRRANRVARHLQAAGLGPQRGAALMMSNHPRFLDALFGLHKVGAYVVPVNTALVGDGLAYILGHSEIRAILCDHEAAPKIAAVRARLPQLTHIWVNTDEAPEDFVLPEGMLDFGDLDTGNERDCANLNAVIDRAAPGLLLYTSGTTGLPKAVVSSYSQLRVKSIGLLAHLLNAPDDCLYTCLPLFHANALLLGVMPCLWTGIPLCLGKRFSASRFWQEVSECGATQFYTVGSMIPVLLKTAPSAFDRSHRVHRVISAACPRAAWRPFEQRFGVKLWEAYGAVDGAGITFFNTGNGPVGSMGMPGRNVRWKLMREDGTEAGVEEPGEFCVYIGSRPESKVPYWKNEKASNEKVRDGWLHTGDLMQKDARGYLFFVGRNTDSMRVRGENVSAYEVEKVVDSFPAVLESAAFPVPSQLGEDDIMVSAVAVEGQTIRPDDLLAHLRGHLPKYALPAWLDIVEELPKTGTHRVIKKELRERGVSASTIRLDDRVIATPSHLPEKAHA